MQFGLPAMINFRCFCQGYVDKTNAVTGPELAQMIEVRRNDLGNLGIAADGLPIHTEHDALAVARDLDRAGTNRLGHELALGHRQWLPLQAQAHAIARGAHRHILAGKFSPAKPGSLQAVYYSK